MEKTALGAPGHGVRPAKPDFDGLILLCRKCLKRQGLDRREVGRSLKRAYRRDGFGRRLRVVEAGCLGPCPKRMLALATPAALNRGQVLLLDPDLPPGAVGDILSGAAVRRSRAEPGAGAQADA